MLGGEEACRKSSPTLWVGLPRTPLLHRFKLHNQTERLGRTNPSSAPGDLILFYSSQPGATEPRRERSTGVTLGCGSISEWHFRRQLLTHALHTPVSTIRHFWRTRSQEILIIHGISALLKRRLHFHGANGKDHSVGLFPPSLCVKSFRIRKCKQKSCFLNCTTFCRNLLCVK